MSVAVPPVGPSELIPPASKPVPPAYAYGGRPAGSGLAGPSSSSRGARLFSFGVISDIQFAPIPDGRSFAGTPRYYRAALDGTRRAVARWRQQGVDFAVHFGDVLDGYCPRDQSEAALTSVLSELGQLQRPTRHMLGNHCLYNLPRGRLNERLDIPHAADGASYYAFTPHPGFRFVVLDAYDISILGWPAGHPHHEQARRILDERNPNQVKNSPEGLEGPARRFVAFGGGISERQLEWLRTELAQAAAAGQRVLVACHLPMHPATCPGACLLWNYEEVLQAIQQAGCVVATISGHSHQDGYTQDEAGVHHRVLKGVVETPPGRDCYGWVDVYERALDLHGVDTLVSDTYYFAETNGSAAVVHTR